MVTANQRQAHRADRTPTSGVSLVPHVNHGTKPLLIEAFVLRCWARARLCAEVEMSLHEAVDVLQQDAENSGLVNLIGQDAVQAIMAAKFGAFQC
jgi:hypothetical protein